ncbi:hypothetical protein [uncultured Clostridium sp.]|jgi:hypothetical protein|uniref:hypothetical protein n=1 Tax=uncultured Clostridium sp. TaxID=59620 RepID=UPI00280A86BF|nr:hypothetical protein [uncultured Clostridium sp.]
MNHKYYLRVENGDFSFISNEIHEIRSTDIEITKEDYKSFFKLQTQGKSFRLKEMITGKNLSDYVEEYVPEIISEVLEPGIEEMALEHEHRISKLELGV